MVQSGRQCQTKNEVGIKIMRWTLQQIVIGTPLEQLPSVSLFKMSWAPIHVSPNNGDLELGFDNRADMKL